MTQEQKRIKIAEACGWHEEMEPVGSFNPSAWWHNETRYPSNTMPVPDYFNDLNAMHEAEKMLSDGQCDSFLQDLARIAGYSATEHCDEFPNTGLRKVVCATAAQRAEAFGKTLNLW